MSKIGAALICMLGDPACLLVPHQFVYFKPNNNKHIKMFPDKHLAVCMFTHTHVGCLHSFTDLPLHLN